MYVVFGGGCCTEVGWTLLLSIWATVFLALWGLVKFNCRVWSLRPTTSGVCAQTWRIYRRGALSVAVCKSIMGSAIDLTLGCSTQAPKGYPIDDVNPKVYPGGYLESLRKAKEYLRSLEDERRKVEGFKRELPISIKLLEDAIQAFREKLASGKDTPTLQLSCSSLDSEKTRCNDSLESRPTLEEFLPLKRRWGAVQQSEAGSDGDNVEPERTKRPAWMTEGRLWNPDSTSTRACHEEQEKEKEHVADPEQICVTSSQLPFGSKEKTSAGAFLPFPREQPDAAAPSLVSRPTPTMAHSGVGLSLSFGDLMTSPGSFSKAASDIGPEAGGVDVAQISKDVGVVSNVSTSGGDGSSGTKSKRKARRCWAPELHRRFVSALHQLGGAEVATPKQICELMKVDGLTNDEVKSHLQKYRLHTRRPGASGPQLASGAQQPQLVVLGGIWMPPKCPQVPSAGVYDSSSTGHRSHVFQAAAALPQDHYFACISNGASGAAAPAQMHRQPSSHEPQQAASQSQSSPQGSVQVTSQISEATHGPNSEVYRTDDDSGEEEAKSDSTSWQNGSYKSGEELKKKSSSECTSN